MSKLETEILGLIDKLRAAGDNYMTWKDFEDLDDIYTFRFQLFIMKKSSPNPNAGRPNIIDGNE